MLSVKQGGIKYHFLSLWCDSTWDWTQVSWAIGKHYLQSQSMLSLVIDYVSDKNESPKRINNKSNNHKKKNEFNELLEWKWK